MRENEMICRMTIEPDVMTENGRIYTKEAFSKMVSDAKELIEKEELMVFSSPINNPFAFHIENILGVCKDIDEEKRTVLIDFSLLFNKFPKIKNILNPQSQYPITTSGIGKIKDNKVKDYKIRGFCFDYESITNAEIQNKAFEKSVEKYPESFDCEIEVKKED